MCSPDPHKEHLRKQAWEYFNLHAGQRLKTFNFYIVICALLSTALFGLYQKEHSNPWIGLLLGTLLVLFSFIFWKLDERNRELIHHGEAALRFFETEADYDSENGIPHVAKVFSREGYETEEKRHVNKANFWERHFSYSDCFRRVFRAFAAVGILGVILSLTGR